MFGYRKSYSGVQTVGFQLNSSLGAGVTGATVTVNICLDDAGTYSSGSGVVTELGGGGYVYALDGDDTVGNFATIQFSAMGAITVEKTIAFTAGDPTNAQNFGIGALPAAAAGASGGLVIIGTNNGTIAISGSLTMTNDLEIGGSFLIDDGMTVTGNITATTSFIGDFGQVWDTVLADHLSPGSVGEALNAAGGAGDPWITAIPGSYTAGQAGYIVGNNLNAKVGDVITATTDIQARIPAALTANGNIKADTLRVSGTAQTAADIGLKTTEIHQIHGLESGSNLTVSTTARSAAAISQTIATVAGTTTVSR